MRRCAGMGQQYLVPTSTRPECPGPETSPRTCYDRSTSAMRTSLSALIAVAALPVCADELEIIGETEWAIEVANGISGLEVSADGMEFVAVSDKGWVFSGSFDRDQDRIAEISLKRAAALLGNDGLPVAARRIGDWSDAEGLAITEDGTAFVSFERWAHVSRYEDIWETGEWIQDHQTFSEYEENRQLEAAAVEPSGRIITIPERPLRSGFPVYGLEADGWKIIGEISERNGFSAVGADFDSNGASVPAGAKARRRPLVAKPNSPI